MKNIWLLFAFFLVLFSCSQTENNTEIFGTVKGLKKGTLYLQRIIDTTIVTIDTITINGNGEFAFSLQLESPEVLYLFLRKTEGIEISDRLDIFAMPGKIGVQTSLKNFENDAVVTGSINHQKLVEYRKLMQRFNDRNLDLIKEKFKNQQSNNEERFSDINQQMDLLVKNKYLSTINFALNNKDYEIAPYLAISEIFDANIKYLDTIYTSLSAEVKVSSYGKELEKFIIERKKSEKARE